MEKQKIIMLIYAPGQRQQTRVNFIKTYVKQRELEKNKIYNIKGRLALLTFNVIISSSL